MQRALGTATQARHSARIESTESHRVLDETTRNLRLKRQLAALEQDNFHEDPHANLVWHKSIPKFDDNDVGGGITKSRRSTAGEDGAKKRRKLRTEHSKQRFRKNFNGLLDEESQANKDDPSIAQAYILATAPPSKLPPRKFCAACGFSSKYTCIRCGARYCSIRCRDVHNDTRCLKWTS
ncbi:unnamed protein product [Auanema sp. JU1783]|nr:unnamed protein product [Auanema sp. JU1783]